jgi:1-acyl-sn-glycerol-3-phosphate acyltransferase
MNIKAEPSAVAEDEGGGQSATLPALYHGRWERMVYHLWEPICWLIWRYHKGNIQGQPWPGPCILIANHGSYLDWLLLHAVLRHKFHRKIMFIAKEKVARNPWFSPLVRATESIIIVENKASQTVVMAKRALTQAQPGAAPIIGVFPEGQRSRDGQPLPVQSGAAWLARKTGVPLFPVALAGFWEIWPPGRRLPSLKRQRLAIHFLSPIAPEAITDDQATVDLAMRQIYAIVQQGRTAPGAAVPAGNEQLPLTDPAEQKRRLQAV